MSEKIQVEWVANWECPYCETPVDNNDYDIDFSDSSADVTCKELVDKGGDDLEICDHKYTINR